MPAVLKKGKFTVRIWPSDHPPAHVHVFTAGGMAKIALGTSLRPAWLMSSGGLKAAELGSAIRLVKDHETELWAVWRNYHGQPDQS